MPMRIGLFGGSFNPVHCGHLIVARAVAEQLNLSRMILLPCAHPPHKPEMELLDGRHRLEMIRLAVEGETLFEPSGHELSRPGPSYTIDTVEHFNQRFGRDVELFWLIGADSLAELPTWHRAADLIRACRIVTAVRPGWDRIDWKRLQQTFSRPAVERLQAGVIKTPMIDISATDIRARLRSGRSVRYLVPDPVADYLARHHLGGQPATPGSL